MTLLAALQGLLGTTAATPAIPLAPPAATPAQHAVVSHVDGFDAGWDYFMAPQRDGHENDSAPGEKFSTRWGVTEMTYEGALDHGQVTHPFASCTQDDCKVIYRADYWNAMQLDHVHPAVGMVLFVDAALMGVGHVAKAFQAQLGVNPDGVVGKATLEAANAMDPKVLVGKLISNDEAYLASLKNAPTFIHGWDLREEGLQTAALKLV